MKQLAYQWFLLAGIILTASSPAQAQISGDDTLPSRTQVNQTGEISEITGGTQTGNNLFHSFQEFSVPTNSTAFFNNASNITNIIGRVTGGSFSNIDGLIRANGGANLILINPSGISFGSNAGLDIGGSFLASTANSLSFADGSQFSALDDGQAPMLTVSVPLGVQFGANASNVQVQGSNLGVGADQTLALVGGDVDISGGSLTAPGGRIEIGSVADGFVSLNQNPQGWMLGYEGVENFGRVQLGQQASVDVSGIGGGNIQVQSGQLSLQEGSQIRSFTVGNRPGGTVTLRASESVELVGTGFAEFQQSFIAAALSGTISPSVAGTVIVVGTAGTGASSDIVIETPTLSLQNGAVLFSPTFGEGTGGDVAIRGAESVEINSSGILVGTAATGMAGDIEIDTARLGVRDKSVVISATLGDGTGGDVEVNASESVEITSFPTTEIAPGLFLATGIYTNSSGGTGTSGGIRVETEDLTVRNGVISSNTGALLPDEIVPVGGIGGDVVVEAETVELSGIIASRFTSGIGSSTFSSAPAGDLMISTESLRVSEGADISTSTLGAGEGGTLRVNASESVEVLGTESNGLVFGGLLARAGRADIPNVEVSGDAGDLRVATPELIVRNGATVDVQNYGSGDAGTLEIAADLVLIDNQAGITASTRSGQGGNIVIDAENVVWRRGSETTATAGGTGDGGNIFINADTLVALEDSDITANAVEGMGGNIQIEAEGIFLCPTCQVVATSELGVDGEVELVLPETEASLEFLEVPEEVISPEQVVALACPANSSSPSQFTITGRGGLPPRPSESLSPQALVSFDDSQASSNPDPAPSSSELPPPAQGWYVNAQGAVILAAQSATPYSSVLTPPNCHTPNTNSG